MSTTSSEPERKTPEEIARQQGYDVGHKDGFEVGLKAVLDWLEYKYIHDPERPDRGTPEGEAILTLGRESQQYIENLREGRTKLGEFG